MGFPQIIPDNLGYSITDPAERNAWRDLVSCIGRALSDAGLEDEIVFHGTSSVALADIKVTGLAPTDIGEACPVKGSYLDGSFWGTVLTAASYAEDTAVERHPGSSPVLLAIRTATLEADCLLLADGATFEFPNKGTTRLSDPEVERKWVESECDLPWRTSLEDLGAIVATHQWYISVENLRVVHAISDIEDLIAEVEADKVMKPKACGPSPR